MSTLRSLGLVLCLLLLGGCVGRFVESTAPEHGNLSAIVEGAATQTEAEGNAPLAVLIERRAVRAIDPIEAKQRWTHPLRVLGHPTASADTVVIPVRGHRLVAIDRGSGFVRWEVAMPGEALTGLSIAEPYVVASVVGGQGKQRSRLVAFSSHDGGIRWSRRTDGRFGVPLAVGRSVVVPLDEDVVAFDLRGGRERARAHLGHEGEDLQRIEIQGDSVVVAGDRRWVDLGTMGGAGHTLQDAYGPAFPVPDGLDPGHDDGERLQWWVRLPHHAGAPREAVMMSRRAVLAIRLDDQARPKKAHWGHVARDDREFVSMSVGPSRVVLVREDGSVLTLAAEDGRELDAIEGMAPVRGALLLDVTGDPRTPVRHRRPAKPVVEGQLARLLAEPDPRLLPAQRLAADLLWHDEDPGVRELVVELARGGIRASASPAAQRLRTHAVGLVAQPWGQSTGVSVDGLLAELSVEPSFLHDRAPTDLGTAARKAIATGDDAVIPLLVDHLLDPATSATDLTEVARAVRELEHPGAVEGVCTFVRRYHADPEIIYESSAMQYAVDYLLEMTTDAADASVASMAQTTLAAVVDDPFTEPQLRAYIERRLTSSALQARGRHGQQSKRPPETGDLALSDTGL